MKGARIVSFAAACACVCSWVNVMLEWVLLVEHIFIRSWAAFQVYRLETSTGVCTQASLHGNIESKSGKCCRPEKQLSRFDSLAPSPFMSLHPQQHYELRGHRARAVTNVDLSGWGGQVPINISERANKPTRVPTIIPLLVANSISIAQSQAFCGLHFPFHIALYSIVY